MENNAENIFPIFLGLWVIIGVSSAAFFFLNKNAKLKRKIFPPFIFSIGALFIGFVWLMHFPAEAFYLAVPAVILISLLNIRATKFCDSCGKTVMNQNVLSPPKYCSKCGAELIK